MEIRTYLDAATAVAESLGWNGDCVAMDAFEAPLLAVVSVDHAEDDYRTTAGIPPLTDLPTIADLLELPYRSAVSAQSLPTALLRELRKLPEGVIRRRERRVERLVRRPLCIIGVVAAPAPWDRQAEALGRFVTTASRVAYRNACPEPFSRITAEAAIWGIGLGVQTGAGVQLLADPAEPTREVRPYEWWLSEVAYAAWRGSGGSTARPKPRSVA